MAIEFKEYEDFRKVAALLKDYSFRLAMEADGTARWTIYCDDGALMVALVGKVCA